MQRFRSSGGGAGGGGAPVRGYWADWVGYTSERKGHYPRPPTGRCRGSAFGGAVRSGGSRARGEIGNRPVQPAFAELDALSTAGVQRGAEGEGRPLFGDPFHRQPGGGEPARGATARGGVGDSGGDR